ncbi:hypothetical protein SYK_07090 [Pseudodesulfovibrio nedwellii]|uniref:Uncharacterized protein n=2 Tax=Pseudodesulfovibrio nedwellii TaxID=2973072 RepID=A0ABM8AXU9_9BACT|nr:hypothetical protein [Pseudodesulfovibrio nedwellii]BDQ35891.1 hypothetical protein SYK_02510 [Pseudodesulfovibrio nedwellii]BDQ36349.1 hypothetical protein SYK_07090 [Pseudodesulfovibrio nedwellii]
MKWEVRPHNMFPNMAIIFDENGSQVGVVEKEDANLIAAAPEMLAVIKHLCASLEFQKLSRRQIITILTEEITRAEGQTVGGNSDD